MTEMKSFDPRMPMKPHPVYSVVFTSYASYVCFFFFSPPRKKNKPKCGFRGIMFTCPYSASIVKFVEFLGLKLPAAL